jgi:hypothetical protein
VPDKNRHESADLEDYQVLDPSDTLVGNLRDDPLDRGVAAPAHWSAASRFGTTAEEEQAGESLDRRLAEEEPDVTGELADEAAGNQNPERDPGDGPDQRAGRLVAEDAGTGPDFEADLIADDVGIDGGAASAEEAAVHVVAGDASLDDDLDDDDESDLPPGG